MKNINEIEKKYKVFDVREIMPLLKEEVKRKNIRAYFMLAMIYSYSDRKKDLLYSDKLFKKGMKKGCPMCENRYKYLYGDNKKIDDLNLENRLIALGNDILAQTELAFYYFRTLQFDLAFQTASKLNYTEYFESCRMLATLYECGSGVMKDVSKAKEIRRIFFEEI